ncbi:MAG: hypothetical protein QOF61_618, partial [Acidobacteriota bacterium]|nr:hypothetical protein [Acidobacteriota bacterium]
MVGGTEKVLCPSRASVQQDKISCKPQINADSRGSDILIRVNLRL